MPTVAEQLRRAREEQHLSIYQVAEVTKIKTDHLRALEAGDYDSFVAPVYIRGFVRTYVKMLRLDEAQVMADLEAELQQTEKFREPPPLSTHPRGVLDFLMLQVSRLSWRVWLILLVIAAVLALGATVLRLPRHRTAEDPLKSLGPGLHQPKANASGELLPLPTNAPGR